MFDISSPSPSFRCLASPRLASLLSSSSMIRQLAAHQEVCCRLLRIVPMSRPNWLSTHGSSSVSQKCSSEFSAHHTVPSGQKPWSGALSNEFNASGSCGAFPRLCLLARDFSLLRENVRRGLSTRVSRVSLSAPADARLCTIPPSWPITVVLLCSALKTPTTRGFL